LKTVIFYYKSKTVSVNRFSLVDWLFIDCI